MKKILLVCILLLFVAVSGFSQMINLGIMGTYNPYNPSFWSVGPMFMASFNGYDKVFSHFFRVGAPFFGEVTQTYERENIYSSNKKVTEYWQKSFYTEFILLGYAFQICFVDFFALRIGADFYFSYAQAYEHPATYTLPAGYGLNFGLTGLGGLVLFPKKPLFISIDVCPGLQPNTFWLVFENAKEYRQDIFFVMPIRITVGTNFGTKWKK